MKIKTIVFYSSFLCLFIISLVYGDTNGSTTNNPSNGVNGINFSDPQKPIVVKKDQPTFTIILQSNHTTGFSWSLKSYDPSLVKPVSSAYVTFASKNKLIGGGGYEKWVFTVKPVGFVVPQTTNITLIYARPWDLQGAQALNFKMVTAQ